MKKAVKLSAVVLFAGLAFGCASQGDFDDLKARVDGLETKVNKASSDAAAAMSAANNAASEAAAAKEAADRAAQYAQDTNAKLDNMFNRSMRK
jgi:murein lipoprotein